MATALTKAKRKRTAKKNVVLNQILPSCETLFNGDKNDETIAEAKIMLATLMEAANEVKALDEQVSDLTDDDDEYENNEKDAYEFALAARKVEGKLLAFVDKFEETKPQWSMGVNGAMQPLQQRLQQVKLPKFELQKFDGDVVKWRTFIETFDVTIHARSNISNIEKFTYLHGRLLGSALQTIDGMPLTSDNYLKAKDLLEQRYGNQQLIVASHMNALVKINKIVKANAKELRNLYDKVELNIRSLESAGVNSVNFGPLLIPIVQISRKLGTDNWGMADFMKNINQFEKHLNI